MIWWMASFAFAVCGDGTLDGGETCDDANTANGDGCESCQVAHYWECAQPSAPFRERVYWNGVTDCGSPPNQTLADFGVPVRVPDWSAMVILPTGLDCFSPWSSGDNNHWYAATAWQAGDGSDRVSGTFATQRTSRAACLAESVSQSWRFDPMGQSPVYVGMNDTPCTDNRGGMQIDVVAVSDCVFAGDLDDDGVLNDDDDCPTVYNHLPGPFADNEACISETATWDDAVVGWRGTVHRDAVISGVFVAPLAEIGARTRIGPGSVVGRSASIGVDTKLGADVVIGRRTRVGDRVTSAAGGAVEGLSVSMDVVMGDDITLGTSVVIGPWVHVGDDASLGDFVITARSVAIGNGATVDDSVILGPVARVGHRSALADRVRLRRGARIGDSARVGSAVIVARDASIGDRAVVGANSRLRREARVLDDAVVPDGTYVSAGAVVPF